MFNFRPIEMSDKDRVNSCLAVSDFRGCEYSFANNLAWRRLADTLIDFKDDFYISCSFCDKEPYFTFPSGVKTDESGRQRYIELFEELKAYTERQGKTYRLTSVTKENAEWIKQVYGDKITITADRDGFDYIYKSKDLIELKGKKFHGKRNHIKRFKETDWRYEPLDKSQFDECTVFAAGFYNSAQYTDFSAVVEQYAIHTFFSHFDELGLKGGVLYSGGRLVGFTIGERLNSDTFVVHIEKADSAVQGAYPTLCNEFAAAQAEELEYINREEDLGIEGLRKSKLSYNPVFLHEKYTVAFM